MNLDAGESEPVNVYVVPWALPREPMPLRATWPNGFPVDKVLARLPVGFRALDFLNVAEASVTGRELVLIPRLVPSLTTQYLGVVLQLDEVPTELHRREVVSLTFESRGEEVWKGNVVCNVFRPTLELKSKPNDLVLVDNGPRLKLPMSLKYVGFGEVRLAIKGILGGRLVSTSESLLSELMKRLWSAGMFDETPSREVSPKDQLRRSIRLSPQFIEELATSIQQTILTGQSEVEDLGPEDLALMREWLVSLKEKGMDQEILYSRVQALLLDIMAELFERHPARDVTLATSRARVMTRITAPIESLTIEVHYTDLMNNEYEPVRIPIQITDKRERDRGLAIEAPITIESVEFKPFLDVASGEGLRHEPVESGEAIGG